MPSAVVPLSTLARLKQGSSSRVPEFVFQIALLRQALSPHPSPR